MSLLLMMQVLNRLPLSYLQHTIGLQTLHLVSPPDRGFLELATKQEADQSLDVGHFLKRHFQSTFLPLAWQYSQVLPERSIRNFLKRVYSVSWRQAFKPLNQHFCGRRSMLSTFPPNSRSSPMSSLMEGRYYFFIRLYMYYFDQIYYDCS